MIQPRAFHIIDPGLMEVGGHYYTQDFSIAKECQRRGIPVNIFCRKGANLGEHSLRVIELLNFDVFVEKPPEIAEFGVFENYFLVNRAFHTDLDFIPVEELSPDDIVYFPGLTQNQIEGVSDWVSSLPVHRRPHIAITLRFLNSQMHYNLNRGLAPSIEFLYRYVLAKLVTRHPRSYLFTDTNVLSLAYQRMSGIPVKVLPIPQVEFHNQSSQDTIAHKKPLTILYIGNTSPYRGHYFIANIIENVLSEYPDVCFSVQVKSGKDSDEARGMVAIADIFKSRVNYLFDALSPEEYVATLKSADIILLPYMPAYYYFGSSGVFTEAAALGKVVVITAGTTMENMVNEHGLSAVIAKEYTAEAFVAAVKSAIVNYPELDRKASASHVAYARENSPQGFLDAMFSNIG